MTISGPATGSYNSKDVATANLVTFNGLSTANGNYTITAPTQAATITAKPLTVTGLSVPSSKVYDGTTATATPSGTAASRRSRRLSGRAGTARRIPATR